MTGGGAVAMTASGGGSVNRLVPINFCRLAWCWH